MGTELWRVFMTRDPQRAFTTYWRPAAWVHREDTTGHDFILIPVHEYPASLCLLSTVLLNATNVLQMRWCLTMPVFLLFA